MISRENLAKGARNLLVNCADCQLGDTLLIVRENDDTGYYDPELCLAIKEAADDLGLVTQIFGVCLSREVTDPSEDLARRMQKADCTVFLARLGDQIRFRAKKTPNKQVISYALDCEMLASSFGTIDYQAFQTLKEMVNKVIFKGSEIHVTCPAGTDVWGAVPSMPMTVQDTTLKRFPVSVFAPIPGDGFRGRIAQNGFLTGTGSHYYTPWSCALKDTLFIDFEGTRITGFDGWPDDVAAAQAHYEFVGNKYGIDTYYLHSWHAGIHPGCEFREPAGNHFERWGGGAFGNPRLLHFHTCGAYPPGEISLNVLDATVRVDGVALWEDGELYVSRIPGGEALLDEYPDMRAIFEKPATRVGQAANGKLSYA